eukprot:5246165-Alexandrium_andersonii.AAC.1
MQMISKVHGVVMPVFCSCRNDFWISGFLISEKLANHRDVAHFSEQEIAARRCDGIRANFRAIKRT